MPNTGSWSRFWPTDPQMQSRGNNNPVLFRVAKVPNEYRVSNAASNLFVNNCPNTTPCIDIFVELTNAIHPFRSKNRTYIAHHPSLRDRGRRMNWILEVKCWLSICTPREGTSGPFAVRRLVVQWPNLILVINILSILLLAALNSRQCSQLHA